MCLLVSQATDYVSNLIVPSLDILLQISMLKWSFVFIIVSFICIFMYMFLLVLFYSLAASSYLGRLFPLMSFRSFYLMYCR
jgi:hypothetical protein